MDGGVSFLLSCLDRPIGIAMVVLGSVALLICYTHISTHRNLIIDIQNAQLPAEKGAVMRIPQIPYTFPLIGNTLEFFRAKPLQFWKSIAERLPAEIGAYTIRLAGDVTHVITDQTAVQRLYTSKASIREGFVINLLVSGFGMEQSDAFEFYHDKDAQEQMMHRYLVKHEAVNSLIGKFGQLLKDRLLEQPEEQSADLMEWLYGHMFQASTVALLGSGIFEVYPDLYNDFWPITPNIVALMLRIPKFWKPEPYATREKLLSGMIRWQETMLTRCNNKIPDPATGEDWEPIYGSRLSRARQERYSSCGFSLRSRAGADVAMLFALAGNAIPITGWILLHIICPQDGKPVLEPIMKELRTAIKEDGKSLDTTTLCNLPLLQSIYHEGLRKYTDLLIARTFPEDTKLPLRSGDRETVVKKGEVVMISSFLSHNSTINWDNPGQFCPRRFLKEEKEGEKTDEKGVGGEGGEARCPVFNGAGITGKLVPFGGGRHACPGKKFAHQEIIIGIAMVLLSFDIQLQGFVDKDGKPTDRYPEATSHFPGSGVMQKAGDAQVLIRRRAQFGQ